MSEYRHDEHEIEKAYHQWYFFAWFWNKTLYYRNVKPFSHLETIKLFSRRNNQAWFYAISLQRKHAVLQVVKRPLCIILIFKYCSGYPRRTEWDVWFMSMLTSLAECFGWWSDLHVFLNTHNWLCFCFEKMFLVSCHEQIHALSQWDLKPSFSLQWKVYITITIVLFELEIFFLFAITYWRSCYPLISPGTQALSMRSVSVS